jgi:hypothetical protein
MSITTSEIVSFFTLGLSLGVTMFVIWKLRIVGGVNSERLDSAERVEIEGLIREFTERLRRLEERIVDQSIKLELHELRWKRGLDLRGDRSSLSAGIDVQKVVGYVPESVVREEAVRVRGKEYLDGTEGAVLRLVMLRGSVSGPELEKEIGKSREHTARVLSSLFSRGFVERDSRTRPFKYSITGAGRDFVEK